MNHNFLPYEVCCMLPENNPYGTPNTWVLSNDGETPFLFHQLHYKSIRYSWTILDALQWLEDEHNIMVEVCKTHSFEDDFVYTHWATRINNPNEPLDYIKTTYSSRTEAYIEGIKEALKLIK